MDTIVVFACSLWHNEHTDV